MMSKIMLLLKRHRYIFQYVTIIILASFFFYIPNLLQYMGVESIKPADFFNPKLETFIDAIYFSIVSITTLGFGDIIPISQWMKVIVSIEVLLGIFTIGQALNSIAKTTEEKRRLPHRFAAYEDVRLLTTRLIYFWKEIYIQSVPGESPKTIFDLLSEESISKMKRCLDLDGMPNVHPPRTWWDFLPQQSSDMAAKAEKILERHIEVLNPKVFALIHNLLSHGMLNSNKISMMSSIRVSDQATGFPRPSNLGNYTVENEKSLNPIIELNKWCKIEYEKLKTIGGNVIPLIKPYTYLQESTVENPPSYMTPEKLSSQQIRVAAYRENKKEF